MSSGSTQFCAIGVLSTSTTTECSNSSGELAKVELELEAGAAPALLGSHRAQKTQHALPSRRAIDRRSAPPPFGPSPIGACSTESRHAADAEATLARTRFAVRRRTDERTRIRVTPRRNHGRSGRNARMNELRIGRHRTCRASTPNSPPASHQDLEVGPQSPRGPRSIRETSTKTAFNRHAWRGWRTEPPTPSMTCATSSHCRSFKVNARR